MDIALFPGQSRRQWADTMINLEARKLVNTANTVAAMHLSDSLTRLKFVDEIRQVVMQQFEAARRARNDEDCIRGSTPEPPKFPLPQFQPSNQCIQVNNFIAALEGIMSVQQDMLPGHRRYPGQSLNALVVSFCFQPFQ